MLKSLQDTVQELTSTQSAIHQALMSPVGLQVAWIVVEAEEDVAVYEKFMQRNSTIVKTSEDSTGRKGYANVEIIVREIKKEEPKAHIMGIRDADYSRYNEGYVAPANIFLTDCRDLEMMLLSAKSVNRALKEWAPSYEEAFEKCKPICRHFGYLRIFNEEKKLSVRFHDNLRPAKFWNFQQQALVPDWESASTTKFIKLAKGRCSDLDIMSFVIKLNLKDETVYNVCRGHDLLHLLSLNLVDVQKYSVSAIMSMMIEAYSLDDFKCTQLYASILAWQTKENVNALVA